MDPDRCCARCGEEVQYLSSDDLCDGCVAEVSRLRHVADELTRFTEELGLYECEKCGHYPDTPNHFHGCEQS